MKYGIKNAKNSPTKKSPQKQQQQRSRVNSTNTNTNTNQKNNSNLSSPSKKKMKTPSFGQIEMENVIVQQDSIANSTMNASRQQLSKIKSTQQIDREQIISQSSSSMSSYYKKQSKMRTPDYANRNESVNNNRKKSPSPNSFPKQYHQESNKSQNNILSNTLPSSQYTNNADKLKKQRQTTPLQIRTNKPLAPVRSNAQSNSSMFVGSSHNNNNGTPRTKEQRVSSASSTASVQQRQQQQKRAGSSISTIKQQLHGTSSKKSLHINSTNKTMNQQNGKLIHSTKKKAISTTQKKSTHLQPFQNLSPLLQTSNSAMTTPKQKNLIKQEIKSNKFAQRRSSQPLSIPQSTSYKPSNNRNTSNLLEQQSKTKKSLSRVESRRSSFNTVVSSTSSVNVTNQDSGKKKSKTKSQNFDSNQKKPTTSTTGPKNINSLKNNKNSFLNTTSSPTKTKKIINSKVYQDNRGYQENYQAQQCIQQVKEQRLKSYSNDQVDQIRIKNQKAFNFRSIQACKPFEIKQSAASPPSKKRLSKFIIEILSPDIIELISEFMGAFFPEVAFVNKKIMRGFLCFKTQQIGIQCQLFNQQISQLKLQIHNLQTKKRFILSKDLMKLYKTLCSENQWSFLRKSLEIGQLGSKDIVILRLYFLFLGKNFSDKNPSFMKQAFKFLSQNKNLIDQSMNPQSHFIFIQPIKQKVKTLLISSSSESFIQQKKQSELQIFEVLTNILIEAMQYANLIPHNIQNQIQELEDGLMECVSIKKQLEIMKIKIFPDACVKK